MKRSLFLLIGSLVLTDTGFAQAPIKPGARSVGGASSALASRLASAPAALQIFPNPSHGDFTVKLPDAVPRAGLQLELVNVLGHVVLQQALPAAAQFTVPASTVPTGLYWVRLRGPQGYQATQRVVLG